MVDVELLVRAATAAAALYMYICIYIYMFSMIRNAIHRFQITSTRASGKTIILSISPPFVLRALCVDEQLRT